MYLNNLGAVFKNPTWWVKAYEAAVTSAPNYSNPMDLVDHCGLTPVLNAIELNGLSILLSMAQEQLLRGYDTITLIPAELRKYFSMSSRSNMFAFDRTIQLLSGLKLVSRTKLGVTNLVPLFTEETWKSIDLIKSERQLEFSLSSLGAELILGISEPYSELSRLLQKKVTVESFMNRRKPLALRQSIWLDLQGLEQALMLRLEKKMQWESQYLRLDGAFGCSLAEVFSGLEISRRGRNGWSKFMAQTRVLNRLGKKLVDHGLLSFQSQDGSQYLALGRSIPGEVMLVWNLMNGELSSDLDSGFSVSAANYIRDKVYYRSFENILQAIAGNLVETLDKSQLLRTWSELMRSVDHNDYLGVIDHCTPVFASSLFFEWCVRQYRGHNYSMVTDHLDPKLIELTSPTARSSLAERYQSFLEMLRSSGDILGLIEGQAGLSLISRKTQESSHFHKFVDQFRDRIKVNLPIKNQNSESKSYRVSRTMSASESVRSIKSMDSLKREASNQLVKLRSDNPERYRELKQAYINTLDLEKKRIVVEVMSRLQPETFDDQLRNSLIKYMVEHPTIWLGEAFAAHSLGKE